jgi:hypothetical protein
MTALQTLVGRLESLGIRVIDAGEYEDGATAWVRVWVCPLGASTFRMRLDK